MSKLKDIVVPDIGDFDSVEIIEVLVVVGDSVQIEDPLLTLESDKASMEIPSPVSGIIKEISVKVGDSISENGLILRLEESSASNEETQSVSESPQTEPDIPQSSATQVTTTNVGNSDADLHAEVVVLGAGPGGYTAAFRAADLGKQVILIERYESLGGVCLNVGCIPSKALLHQAQIIHEAEEMSTQGIKFSKPELDIDAIRGNKENIINRLTGGLLGLAKQRKVKVITGHGSFVSDKLIQVESGDQVQKISFDNVIIAAGSQPVKIPGFPYEDPRLIDSTGALELEDIPEKLLVIGGGIIGLEMATVYHALGSQISVVELMEQLIPGCDKDLVRPLHKHIEKQYEAIYLKTKVTEVKPTKKGLKVTFEGEGAPKPMIYDRVLLAVGRIPNGKLINAETAGVHVDARGFIPVDKQQHTNIPHIYAIGDIVGNPMLAHKATHEAKVAAEVIAGEKTSFDALTIPSVAYTDPEVAWMGLTETDAKENSIKFEKSVFPWAASGRALSIGRDEGLTKILWDPDNQRILGAGIVGQNAGELIAEAVLALEMGADWEDMSLTIHPHPTLSETLNFSAEMQAGSITDLYVKKKAK
jgi:dihydrolipoamide dehydrogenase